MLQKDDRVVVTDDLTHRRDLLESEILWHVGVITGTWLDDQGCLRYQVVFENKDLGPEAVCALELELTKVGQFFEHPTVEQLSRGAQTTIQRSDGLYIIYHDVPMMPSPDYPGHWQQLHWSEMGTWQEILAATNWCIMQGFVPRPLVELQDEYGEVSTEEIANEILGIWLNDYLPGVGYDGYWGPEGVGIAPLTVDPLAQYEG